MFKPVPGNSYYAVSLNDEIRNSDGTACTLEITNNKVTLPIHGELKTLDLTWLGLIAHYEMDLPEALRKHRSQIYFTTIDSLILRNKADSLMAFTHPIWVDREFRVIPGYTAYCINQDGVVKELNGGVVVREYASQGNQYPFVQIYDPDKGVSRSVYTHRLLALTWLPNPDPTSRYIVNHKDGIKSNNKLWNLEWVTVAENNKHAFLTGLRGDNINMRVRDFVTGGVHEFASVTDACAFMQTPTRPLLTLLPAHRGKLFMGRYEMRVGEDDTEWFYEGTKDEVRPGKYTITVTHSDEGVEVFYGVRAMIKGLGIWNTPTHEINHIIDCAKVKYPGIKIDVDDHQDHRPVQAYRVATGEIVDAPSIRELSRLLKVTFSQVRYNLLLGETRVSDGYAYRRYSETPWNADFNEAHSKPKCILATNLKTNETLEFKSLREAANHFGKDRSLIKHRMKTGKLYGDWEFKEL